MFLLCISIPYLHPTGFSVAPREAMWVLLPRMSLHSAEKRRKMNVNTSFLQNCINNRLSQSLDDSPHYTPTHSWPSWKPRHTHPRSGLLPSGLVLHGNGAITLVIFWDFSILVVAICQDAEFTQQTVHTWQLVVGSGDCQGGSGKEVSTKMAQCVGGEQENCVALGDSLNC